MGAGPEHLVHAGLGKHLQAHGHDVLSETLVSDRDGPAAEVRTTFDLMCRLAQRVRAARDAHRFPLVLAGNCSTACGTLSGLTPHRRAVFWFDAHGDVNTPSTTTTGFVDGMALATAQGLCWERLAGAIPGFEPIPPSYVFLLGARDLDPPELALIARSGIAHIPPDRLAGDLPTRLATAALDGALAYVHCDLDVLDPAIGQANPFPAPGGLSVEALTAAIRTIGAAIPLGAAAIAAYAPECDPPGAVTQAAFAVAEAIVGAAELQCREKRADGRRSP